MPNNLIERVLKTIRSYEMLDPGDSVLVAVSGGPDSVFLLQALYALKSKLKLKKLVVCNLDHGLRYEESAADSLFVKDTAEKLGLEFVHKKINLANMKPAKISTEEAGREARYKFFREAAEAAGADVIATGHTLDDQAETILMRLIKGAALKGIVGISPVRGEGDLKVVRPLIELEKRDIVRYLDKKKALYRIDSTNSKALYFRNVVRNEIMPILEKYNPRLKRVLFNLAEHLREDFEFIEEEKEKAKHLVRGEKAGIVEIKINDIAVQPKAIQKEILRDALEKAGGIVKKLSFRHWKEMESLIKHKRKGNSVDLPGSVRIMRTERYFILQRI